MSTFNQNIVSYYLDNYQLSMEQLEKYVADFNSDPDFNTHFWELIVENQNLTEEFIEKYIDSLTWELVTEHQKLDESFLKKNDPQFNKTVWKKISKHQELTPEFIDEYEVMLDLELITEHQKLTESFLVRNSPRFTSKIWKNVSQYQELPESFMKRYRYALYWDLMTRHQKMSEPFVYEFKKWLNWDYIADEWAFTKEFKEKYAYYLDKNISNSQKCQTDPDDLEKFWDNFVGQMKNPFLFNRMKDSDFSKQPELFSTLINKNLKQFEEFGTIEINISEDQKHITIKLDLK
jgi:hypothetical protein